MIFDFESGRIDNGDAKLLSVTPKDSDGASFVPTTLVAVFTSPSGSDDTYNLGDGDFTESGGVYTVSHLFDESGVWNIKVTATDSNGNPEVDKSTVRVY